MDRLRLAHAWAPFQRIHQHPGLYALRHPPSSWDLPSHMNVPTPASDDAAPRTAHCRACGRTCWGGWWQAEVGSAANTNRSHLTPSPSVDVGEAAAAAAAAAAASLWGKKEASERGSEVTRLRFELYAR